MSEQVLEPPAPRSPMSRFIGVIVSPAETLADVARSPGWIFPLVCYFVVFFIAFGVYSSKADWIAIVTEQIESFPLLRLAPEQAQEQAVRQATDTFRKLSPGQITAQTILQYGSGFLLFFHGMAVVYATLFVLMGSLTSLRLGRTWLNFVLCLIVYVGYVVVSSIASVISREDPGGALMISGPAAVVMVFAWGWLLDRFTLGEPEFRKMLAVSAHVAAVFSVGALALLAVSVATPDAIAVPPESMVKSNLGALVATGVPVLQKLLESIDFFTIWALIVLTIGYRAVTRLSAGVTASMTFLPWGLWVLIKVAFAAAFG